MNQFYLISLLFISIAWAFPAESPKPLQYALYADIDGVLETIHVDDTKEDHGNLIWGGRPGKPLRFSYFNNTATSMDIFNKGGLVTNTQNLTFSNNLTLASQLELSDHMRLKNSFYYSCKDRWDGLNTIYPWKNDGCFRVDLYFLPFDPKTQSYVRGSFKPEEYKLIQFALYANMDSSLNPVYAGTMDPDSKSFASLKFGATFANPLHLITQNGYAFIENASPLPLSGYVSYTTMKFGFGHGMGHTNLEPDEAGKLEDRGFQACWDLESQDFTIAMNATSDKDACEQISLYLLPSF